MPIEQLVYNDQTHIPTRIARVIRYFPQWQRNSTLIHMFATRIAEEADARVGDFWGIIGTGHTVLGDDLGLFLDFWSEALNVPISSSEDISTRKAKVLSKLTRINRIRTVDIGTIIRMFLIGPKIFVHDTTVEESNLVTVNSVSGLFIGQTIFIGATPATILNIDVQSRLLILDRKVTAHAYQVITITRVEIEEIYDQYAFNVFIDFAQIPNQVALLTAIEEAKPAHLDYTVVDLVGNQFFFDDEDSYFGSEKTLGPRIINS